MLSSYLPPDIPPPSEGTSGYKRTLRTLTVIGSLLGSIEQLFGKLPLKLIFSPVKKELL